MLKIENALLLDICLGFPLGKIWFPADLPKPPAAEIPPTFLLKGDQLASLKQLYIDQDQAVLRAVTSLNSHADKYLQIKNPTVTAKEETPSQVGTAYDYLSLAKYWWPNPDQENGLPYIRKDGAVNPECYSDQYDLTRLELFSEALLLLSLSAFLSGNDNHANKAVSMINTWFIDLHTRQTPHFKYAQIVLGKNEPSHVGLIEARRLIYCCEAMQLLKHIGAIEPKLFEECQLWFNELLTWFIESEQGKKASEAKNNIGFWYDLQTLVYALFTGKKDQAEQIIKKTVLPRTSLQVDKEGKLINELSRAKPYDYVAFTLLAMAELDLAGTAGEINLPALIEEEGRSYEIPFNWFNDTINSNKLQQPAVALMQQLSLQRQIKQLKGNSLNKLNNKETEVATKPDQILSMREENTALRNELNYITRNLLNIGLHYHASNYIMQKQANEIETIELKVAKTKAIIEQRIIEVEERERQADQKDLQLRIMHETIGVKDLQIKNMRESIHANEVELQSLNQECRNYKNECAAMKNSTSWKITSPLRYLARIIKGNAVNYKQGIKIRVYHLLKVLKNIVIPSSEKDKYKLQVAQEKNKLLKLGFFKRAYAELSKMALDGTNRYRARVAAWELALWHANRNSKEDAEKSLEFLEITKNKEKNNEFLSQIAIIEAECHELIGDFDLAKQTIYGAFRLGSYPDLFLAMANLENDAAVKLKWINNALDLYGLSRIMLSKDQQLSSYDRLTTSIELKARATLDTDMPKVTIIIPAYNSEETISTTLASLILQTWSNLEIIVVDDCSNDRTIDVVSDYMKKDTRIQLLKTEVNSGPYVARNIALEKATGEFVTVNDADDWSHPEKIEKQSMVLIDNPSIIANTSQQARVSQELKFSRRGLPGFYIQLNMSSLMFRRQEVIDFLGYWDSVRFAADSEFVQRIKRIFGNEALLHIKSGPLSFQRQSSNSLTGDKFFGYPGFKMGVRKEYEEAHNHYFTYTKSFKYSFPQKTRPFPVPEPMWPKREIDEFGWRHFDIVHVSDYRHPGGTTFSNLEEIKVQKKLGLRTGLVQMSRYDLKPGLTINPVIRDVIDGDKVQMLAYGEKITCDLIILRFPMVLQELQRYLPNIKAKNIRVIINQPPKRDYRPGSKNIYDIKQCKTHLIKYFGKSGIWHPIGPLVRKALHEFHSDDLKAINLSDEDWVNIINIEEWKRSGYCNDQNSIKIGRHSRDQYVKWPDNRDDLLKIYPESSKYEIHVLGGAKAAKKVIGYLPANWHVMEFGAIHPKEFLAKLDVFVYYTHPDWVESFGRVIIEAMASGVPVFLPPIYKKLFREAAIYAEPHELESKIYNIVTNKDLYESQVITALKYVEEAFGYTQHVSRLTKIVRQAKDPVGLIRTVKPKSIDLLKQEYYNKGLDQLPDTFALYRIIGNELYPRHKKGQSRENLKFILENEPSFENCEKIFVVNRIIDKEEEKAIIELLNEQNKEFIHLPFVEKEYRRIGFDSVCFSEPGFLAGANFSSLGPEQKSRAMVATYRLKNNYVMNNNGARNVALIDGKSRAKWVLPWDGNCYITKSAWEEITHEILNSPYLKYFAVPMARVTDNALLLSDDFIPEPVEEPQLLFRKDTQETFNENFCYGRRPKVELFWRLGIPGKWDNWQDDPWDLERSNLSPEAGQFGVAGWVARLHSGAKDLEQGEKSAKMRSRVRNESIIKTLQEIDLLVTSEGKYV